MKVDIKGVYSDEGGRRMKIKTVKKLRLDELIKYVWENDIRKETYEPKLPGTDQAVGNIVKVGETGGISFDNLDTFVSQPFQTYVVTTEEELTEETEFEELHEYYWDEEYGLGVTEIHSKQTILGIHEEHDEETIPLSIMMRDKRDNRPVLIWSRDTGIPAEGVIEV